MSIFILILVYYSISNSNTSPPLLKQKAPKIKLRPPPSPCMCSPCLTWGFWWLLGLSYTTLSSFPCWHTTSRLVGFTGWGLL